MDKKRKVKRRLLSLPQALERITMRNRNRRYEMNAPDRRYDYGDIEFRDETVMRVIHKHNQLWHDHTPSTDGYTTDGKDVRFGFTYCDSQGKYHKKHHTAGELYDDYERMVHLESYSLEKFAKIQMLILMVDGYIPNVNGIGFVDATPANVERYVFVFI